jgi:hypothetical protein
MKNDKEQQRKTKRKIIVKEKYISGYNKEETNK